MDKEQIEEVAEITDADEPKDTTTADEELEGIEAAEADADEEKAEATDDDDDSNDKNGEDGGEAPKLVKWQDDDGNEFEVPEALTTSLMKNKDYTQKSQANAEAKRLIEEDRAAFEAEKKRDKEDLQLEAEAFQLQTELQQFDALNWEEIEQNDLYEAQRLQLRMGRVQQRLQQKQAEIETRRNERLEGSQRETAKRIQEADDYGRANVPGWSQGKDQELIEFAREIGISDETLRANLSAPLVNLLHLGSIGRGSIAAAKEAGKPKAKPGVKPNGKVSGKSSKTNSTDLTEVSMDAYVAARKRGANPRLRT